QHAALPAVRREPEVAAGAAALGLLHAQGLVVEDPAAGLHAAVGGAGPAELSVDQLDAERSMGADQQCHLAGGAGRWSAVARHAEPRAGVGDLRPYLEMAAVLDPD